MLLRSGTALQSNSAMKPIADPTVLLDTVCVEIGTKEQGKKKKKNKKKKGANKPQTPVIQSFAQCSKCEEAFTDVAAFNAHVIGSHPFLRPMYCVVADTAKDLYPCEECKMFIVPFPGFKTKGDLFLCFHCRLQCLGQWGCCGCGFLSDEVPDYIPDDDTDDLCADCQQRDDLFKKNSTSTSIPTTNTSTSTTTSSSTSIEPTTSTSSTPSSTSATHPPTSSPLSLASQSAVEGAASLDLERVSSICCSLKEKIADPLPLSSIDEGVPSNFRRDSQKDPEARPVPSSLTPATLTSSTMPSIDHSSSTTSDIAKTSIPASDTHVPRSDPQPHPDISESTTPPVSTTPDSSLPATDTFASTGAQERTSVRSYAQAVSGGSRSSSPTSLPHRSASRERQRQSYSANPVQPKGLDGPSAHGKPTQRDKTRPPTLTIPDNPPAPTQASSKTAAKVSPGASPATTPAKPISCAREAYGKTATTGSYSFPYFSSFSSYCDNSSFFIPKPPVTLGEMRDGLYAAYSHLYGRPVFLGYLKFIDTI